MTHPKRAESAQTLISQTPKGRLSLIMDPDPSGPPSALRTALVAWSSIGETATHHLVVQDDMVLSENFFDRAHRAIEAMPDAALALFSLWDSRNGSAVRLGALAGARWVPAVNEYTPCAALILPKDVAAGYVDYARNRQGTWPEDILMHRYLRAAGVRTFIGVPNLVEHRDLSSLAGNSFRGPRLSACFLSDDAVTEEDSRLADLSAVPFFKNGVARCVVRVPGSRNPRWLHLHCEQYLRRWGVSVEELRARLPRVAAEVDPTVAWGTWLTSYTLGLVHRIDQHDTARGLAGRRQSDSDVVSRALASVGPGGVCHVLSSPQIAEVKGHLSHLASRGVEAGLESTGTQRSSAGSRRARSRSDDRVAVLGGSSALGEYVVRGLTDYGHRITVVDSAPPDGAHPDVHYVDTDLSVLKNVISTLADASAVVDLAGLVPVSARAAQVVPPVICFTSLDDRSTAQNAYLLRMGTVYGPGCSPHSVIGRMVTEALLGQLITLRSAPTTAIYPLHVNDLVSAVSTTLTECMPGRALTVATGPARTVREVAETVRKVVRPVPIEVVDGDVDGPADDHVAECGPDIPTLRTADTLEDFGWRQTVQLDYGIHTFAQWLAYESSD